MKMTRPPFLATAFLAATLFAAASVQASSKEIIYRWYDSNGTPYYSTTPPEGVMYEKVVRSSVNTVDNGRSSDNSPDETAEERNKAAKTDKYTKQLNRLKEEQTESCAQARKNKETLLNNHRIQMTDKNGTVYTLSHEQKLKEIQKADEGIQEYCVD